MRTKNSSREQGFTLIEMLITVVIIGILAAIAVPSFSSYMKRARTSEAYTFIGEIRQRQEAYRAEFNQYCSAPAGNTMLPAAGAATPAGAPNSQLRGWPSPAGTWDLLAARPDGAVRFRYAVESGGPGTGNVAPPGTSGLGAQDFWFVTQAYSDLDDDGILATFESYSVGTQVWIGVAGMTEPQGWE